MFATPALGERAKTDAITSIDDLKRKIARLSELLAQAGRSRAFDICIGPQVGLKDRSRAEVDRLVEHLSELAALGVTWTYFGVPQASRATYIENVQWLGEEVLPRVHAISTPGLKL
jgi:hypothetical protein